MQRWTFFSPYTIFIAREPYLCDEERKICEEKNPQNTVNVAHKRTHARTHTTNWLRSQHTLFLFGAFLAKQKWFSFALRFRLWKHFFHFTTGKVKWWAHLFVDERVFASIWYFLHFVLVFDSAGKELALFFLLLYRFFFLLSFASLMLLLSCLLFWFAQAIVITCNYGYCDVHHDHRASVHRHLHICAVFHTHKNAQSSSKYFFNF